MFFYSIKNGIIKKIRVRNKKVEFHLNFKNKDNLLKYFSIFYIVKLKSEDNIGKFAKIKFNALLKKNSVMNKDINFVL